MAQKTLFSLVPSSESSRVQPRGWRTGLNVLLGFIVLYAAVWIVRVIMGVIPNMLMRWLGASPNFRAYIGSTLNYGVGIVSYLVFCGLALRKVLGVDSKSIFFPLRKGWWKELLFGFLLIAAVLATFFVVEVKAGWLVVDSWNWQNISSDAWLRIAWVGLLVNISVAIGEETIFRSYLLTGLKTAWGKWIGLVLMMVIFGLFHLPAYFEGGMRAGTLTLAILLASLFGLLFGLIYLHTGSLWLPVILHFTWNFVETDLLNLSGDSTNPNLIGALTRLQGPLTMSEIGWANVVVVEMLAFGIIVLGAWFWLKRRQ
jgi:membrane protease YdiL (CAAX protease family)